jgi:hypothetical protein
MLADEPLLYWNLDGTIVSDQLQPNGTRLYSRLVGGRWEPCPSQEYVRLATVGSIIDPKQVEAMIMALEVARTGCAFNDYTFEDD